MTLFKSASRKMWVIAAVLALLGASLGFAVGHAAPRAQTASTVILVTPLDGNAFYPGTRGEQLVNLTTEAQVLKSDKVAAKVIESTGQGSDPLSLLRQLTTTVPPNTQLIEITFENDDPDAAVIGAQAFADAFLEFRSDQAAAYLEGQITGIRDEIEKLTANMGELSEQLGKPNITALERTTLEAQLNAGASQIASLGARESTLATTRIDPGQVVTAAALDRAALLSLRELLAFAGLLAGLGLGMLIMVFMARSNKVLRRVDELKSFGVNALRVLNEAELSRGEANGSNPALARNSPKLTQFRSELLGMVQNSNRRVLLIASADGGCDFPLSYNAVADILASAGLKVLVIDATGRAVESGNTVKLPGIGEVLAGQSTLAEASQSSNQMLCLIGQGELIKQYENGLSSERLNEFLISAGKEFDAVLVIAPDLNLSITQWLVSVIPTVLVEVELGTTKRKDVRAAQNVCVSLAAELRALLIRPMNAQPARHRPRPDTGRSEHLSKGVSGSKTT
ncbi:MULTISPECIES: Wzz/FepE/Etk N-terminal domain-containing protein [unclassified Arthrobacter]|uniref:Wzz/FepE/Etk N-terminal domain-containing protein n=1 Tax=unclassified Arthrobacter TaxID=235627 RepID=UPI0011B05B58|nr:MULTISPECIES: Wzz/FepE/Etk N-terminal domain-containing protein [unclassified Arthrobacter]